MAVEERRTEEEPESSSTLSLIHDYMAEAPDSEDDDDLYTFPEERELHDDYAFLDEDEELEDEDIMVRNANGLPSWQATGGKRRRRRSNSGAAWAAAADEGQESQDIINADLHVVFKRTDTNKQHMGDYRKTQSDY